MDTTDPVIAQLRKLREGPGLTLARLGASGALLSALGTSDAVEAHERLLAALAAHADTDHVRALRVDFGLDLSGHLRREPAVRERHLLGERRSGYGQIVGRDVKTLSRWSDKAIRELRGQLIADSFDGHLFVVAAVRSERIVGISLIRQSLAQTDDDSTTRDSIELTNSSPEASMPCLAYSCPRDWRPASLTLVVVFQGDARPATIWATVAENMLKLPFGEERYALALKEDTASCKFVSPRRDQVYGVLWKW